MWTTQSIGLKLTHAIVEKELAASCSVGRWPSPATMAPLLSKTHRELKFTLLVLALVLNVLFISLVGYSLQQSRANMTAR